MFESQFELILGDLEDYFKVPLKHIEKSVIIDFPFDVKVQIEMDNSNDLLIAIHVGKLIPGHYRNEIFKQALKANNFYSITTGAFGFIKASEKLYLFTFIPPFYQKKERYKDILDPLLAKAQKWAEAIQRGEIPSIDFFENKSSQGLFGLRP